jgi:hypothetical protein
MLWVPQKGKLRVEHNIGSTANQDYGTAVTTGASASTKGSPAELFSSTSFDCYFLTVIAHGLAQGSMASQGSMDLLIGAATEEILIADMLCGYCPKETDNTAPKVWNFPLYIPAGSRLAAQAASARTSHLFRVGAFLHGGDGYPPFRVGGKVTTYGMGTVPDGTTITPGSSGAEGAWAQMTAGTSEDHFALVPSFQPSGVTSLGARVMPVDIGIGAATEEQVAEGYVFTISTVERMAGPFFPVLPCLQDIPSGTRLVMRASHGGTPESTYNGVIHAVS